jgi:hypothetical protein
LGIISYIAGAAAVHHLRFWMMVISDSEHPGAECLHELAVIFWPVWLLVMTVAYCILLPIAGIICVSFVAISRCFEFLFRNTVSSIVDEDVRAAARKQRKLVAERRDQLENQKREKQLRASVADLPVPGKEG